MNKKIEILKDRLSLIKDSGPLSLFLSFSLSFSMRKRKIKQKEKKNI